MTPRTVESKKSRENKDLKRTKMQQTIKTFMEELNKNKQEKSKHNVVAQVEGKRLKSEKTHAIGVGGKNTHRKSGAIQEGS